VHAAPLGRVGAVVGGGANEWMTEVEPVRLDVQQSQRFDFAEIPLGDSQRAECAEHDTGGAGTVRRGDHGRQTATGGERCEAGGEGPLEAVGRRDRVRQHLGSGELAGRQQMRQLDQRKRVPVSGIEDPHQHLRRDPSFVLSQHPRRIFTVEWTDGHDVQTGQRWCAGPLCGNEDGGDTRETPRRKRERVARGRIDPLQIVDDDQRGAVLGSCREQPERRNPDGETIDDPGRAERECGRQRDGLRLRECVESVQDGLQHVDQRCVRKIGLGLHPGRLENGHLFGLVDQAAEQRRLADARFADEHESRAGARPRRGERRRKPRGLHLAADQHLPQA
jgi:hypothetical protein